jgi:heterodisulfide reductase subunit A
MEIGEEIAKGNETVLNAETLVMIQCVGSRCDERNYCSRVCCGHAIKNALKLKEKNPDMDIYVLFRDMRTYGFREDNYREAADKGVVFIRYTPEDPPQLEAMAEGGKSILRVTVPDPILGQRLELEADVVSLAAAVIPAAATNELTSMFKVALSPDHFFKEAHVKLRPVEFATDGAYLCGTAHYPKHLPETINQAYGAASRVLTLLSKDTVKTSGTVAHIDSESCVGCLTCEPLCPYEAISYNMDKGVCSINKILCKGCGNCASACPSHSALLGGYKPEQILAQICVA